MIETMGHHVRFTPKADMQADISLSLLRAI